MSIKIILMSLYASLGLVKQQVVKTFGRDTSVVDKEVVDVILSNSSNKRKLIERLNQNNNSSVEIKIEGNNFSFITTD
ncbi:hypothetical protein IA01_00265 [Flavobacterium psychrophilum]|uniref:Uncharacterized protein n=2 Tax=Flavobacterium psychrophilum TaxID=96345 RepID=A6GVQ3_FLAPJ|nr:hypothetical protein [Flavobacterium psychrophilum]AIG29007.1 hypothetical protein IA03_00215 [Flavobacterium psychrophilum]AIG31283.1 hypothetical protein IA01_00265 [Flavobacterium psychrophilum]AIG35703.1 hypothetical protein IA02_12115 [Flavobacterium psychrophilum]AIG35809.1 hypothetical protein IA04_00215 [Flavobacterium psychrophilum]AIG38064.1 hypothetical protein IA05_00220 [Flavobacterium psychrophilum]